MTKKELITELASELKYSRRHTERIVNKFLAIVQAEVKADNVVKLSGFGTFYRGSKAATKAANPQTGQPIEIPEQILPKFRAGKSFKRMVK